MSAAVNYREYRKRIAQWVEQVSGKPALWERPDDFRLPLPYIFLDLVNVSIRHGQDSIIHDDGDNYNIVGDRSMVVSVSVLTGEKKDIEALEIASNLHASLEDPNRLSFFRQYGLAVWSPGSLQDLSVELETGWENRIQFDVTFGMISTVSTEIGTITSTTVDGEVKDVEGNIKLTTSDLITT